ncbi:hypothetical protein DRO69_07795 [Candidatus Bathyarchaeota archaeon]|nr:MAG: hypothetical protein DRO69_07795 [Candidatus Bathyarchaeota archaeon]
MLFITLLAPKGKGEKAVRYLKELKAPNGITVRGVYFTLGRYDSVILFEAADAETAMRFTMEVGFETNYTVETLTAVSAKEI